MAKLFLTLVLLLTVEGNEEKCNLGAKKGVETDEFYRLLRDSPGLIGEAKRVVTDAVPY